MNGMHVISHLFDKVGRRGGYHIPSMDIRRDIADTKRAWKKAPRLVKLYILLSLFLSVSAIASFADVVFAWKSFLLDGLEFYRHWIVHSVQLLGSLFRLTWTEFEVGTLFIVNMWLAALNRVDKTAPRLVAQGYALGLNVVFGLLLGLFDNSYLTAAVLSLYVGGFVWGGIVTWCEDRERFGAWMSVPGIAVGTVLLLGAINTGLSRPV